jgi:hypothetical protein
LNTTARSTRNAAVGRSSIAKSKQVKSARHTKPKLIKLEVLNMNRTTAKKALQQIKYLF